MSATEQGAATALAMGVAASREAEDVQLAIDASGGGVTAAQVRVLKQTICSKLTMDQLALYLTICARKKVDPFTEAYGFPSENGGLAFGLRIDGMRALAMRTGEYMERKIETLLIPDGEHKGELLGARASIRRKGMLDWVTEEAYMAEYAKSGHGWQTYPETMIRKVAESKALRAAFPDALSGVYEPAEVE